MGGWTLTDQTAGSQTYALAGWLFLRLLGLIYLAAFASLATQIKGLVGRDGVLPAAEFLIAHQHWGFRRFFRFPTVCWLNTSDGALLLVSWGGAVLALLLIFGLAPTLVCALLWMLYLSLFTVCRNFLHYQWDLLLLETGFLAPFLAPLEIAPQFPLATAPSPIIVGLFWWLLFRLMFSSGWVKLHSGDSPWRTLTALYHYYETQPLPTPLAWHAHQLPVGCHKVSAFIMFGIELLAPFLMIAPTPWRHAAAAAFLLLMVLVQLTGNYGFFNLLGIALSTLLLDDKVLLPAFEILSPGTGGALEIHPAPPSCHWVAGALAIFILSLSLEPIRRLIRTEINWPRPHGRWFDLLEPFRFVNSYGLFAIISTGRPEIVVEGSNDGIDWRAYEFKWKPGEVKRALRFVAPHQPRLDWQMWFAALESRNDHAWFDRFLACLAAGSPAIIALLRSNPFPQAPPRYLRGIVYHYRFTTRVEHRATGDWWKRERRGPYGPTLDRTAPTRQFPATR
jgi:hypothetical protein